MGGGHLSNTILCIDDKRSFHEWNVTCFYFRFVPSYLCERNERKCSNAKIQGGVNILPTEQRHVTRYAAEFIIFSMREQQTIVTISFFFSYIPLHVAPSTIYRENTVPFKDVRKNAGGTRCSFFLREKLFFRRENDIGWMILWTRKGKISLKYLFFFYRIAVFLW